MIPADMRFKELPPALLAMAEQIEALLAAPFNNDDVLEILLLLTVRHLRDLRRPPRSATWSRIPAPCIRASVFFANPKFAHAGCA